MAEDRVDGYATALFEVARAEGVLPKVEEELFNLSHLLSGNDELRTTLADPAIPGDRKQAIIDELIGKRSQPVTALLVSFVVSAGRARELPAIISNLVERAAASRRHAVAEVRSAVPLDDDQRRRLAKALSTNLGKEVEVKVFVDPSVLGGLSARVGDVVIDGTVRHRLDQLKETIR
ncbi:MAG TPA: ATP synthase F1 subunit delta [Acidimicrobiales bacterium]|jgi:F-type H+-transporting ATPase subunit delta|nr:ATP synthase F1 subunit delta [Acidimicrobiales bacterium]